MQLQPVSRFKQPLIFTALILTFYILMSRIDFIVHNTLYNYGLQFSYAWANNYWLAYNSLFIAFGVILSITYWLASNKTKKDLRLSISLIGTITLLTIGGLQDILYFVLWEGGLPHVSLVWWWMPWATLVGTWNSLMQVILTALTSTVSIAIMKKAFENPTKIE